MSMYARIDACVWNMTNSHLLCRLTKSWTALVGTMTRGMFEEIFLFDTQAAVHVWKQFEMDEHMGHLVRHVVRFAELMC